MATLKLPFELEKPDTSTPVAKSSGIYDDKSGKWQSEINEEVLGGKSSGGFVVAQTNGTPSSTINVSESAIKALSKGLTLYLKLKFPLPANALMQINSLASRTIKIGGASTKFGYAAAGSHVTLVYDGTDFNIVSIDRVVDNSSFFGTCETATSDTTKIVQVGDDYILGEGNTLTIQFKNALNTAVNQLRLMKGEATTVVTGTIIYEGSTTNIPIEAGNYATFVYTDSKFILQYAKEKQDPPETVDIATREEREETIESGKPDTFYDNDQRVPTCALSYELGVQAAAESILVSTPSYEAAATQEDVLASPKVVKGILDSRILVLTQAEYDAITSKNPNILYFIKEE